tara:strand:+ start:266 stop:718 length:453 start_codon:yes stop_codon:yes gene_type:complete
MLRRTPCIGICSTTYGDLVCRGCKRFAHEIVQWNGFDQAQRSVVWERLLDLREGAVESLIAIDDPARLASAAAGLGLSAETTPAAANLLYEALQRLRWRDGEVVLSDLGARVRDPAQAELPVEALITLIDREFYQRSLAHYERYYRIPAE